jgi:hypothetical protein
MHRAVHTRKAITRLKRFNKGFLFYADLIYDLSALKSFPVNTQALTPRLITTSQVLANIDARTWHPQVSARRGFQSVSLSLNETRQGC